MSSLATFEEIDGRIRALEAELFDLKCRRNALVPICRLPSEIIIKIIGHIQNWSKDPDELFENFDRSWLRLTLVCQRFRDVAVQSPTLRSVLDYSQDSGSWIDLCVQRSQNAQLCIYSHDSGAEVAAEHWSRAHLVKFDGYTIANMFDSSTPYLETLVIVAEDDFETLWISSAVLDNISASIVELHLDGVGVYLDIQEAVSLPNLRWLKLYLIRMDVSLNGLALFLKGAPTLQSLRIMRLCLLESANAVDANEVMPVPEQISLPQLRLLYVEDAPAEVWALLRLIPPPTSAFGVSIIHMGPTAYLGQNHINAYDCWTRFSRRVSGTAEPIIGTIKFDHGTFSSVTVGVISFGDVAGEDDFGQEGSSTSFCSIQCAVRDPHPLLAQIDTLHLYSHPRLGVPVHELEDVYGVRSLPNIRVLVLEDLRDGDKEHMMVLERWIAGRQGQLKQIEFLGCSSAMEESANRFREIGLAESVSWISDENI
jgi:hypothetical protein